MIPVENVMLAVRVRKANVRELIIKIFLRMGTEENLDLQIIMFARPEHLSR